MSKITPRITLIAAMDRHGVIGADGGMPWHIPGDLRWFKAQTIGRPILMGRRTFESIGRALPRRRNLVLTRDPDFAGPRVERVSSLDATLALLAEDDGDELVVIGGAQVYALALPRATCLKITRIEACYAGDTWFPDVDWDEWETVDKQSIPAANDTPAHCFMTLHRRGA